MSSFKNDELELSCISLTDEIKKLKQLNIHYKTTNRLNGSSFLKKK